MSADPTRPRRTVPRWIIETWLWVTVLAAVLERIGCPLDRARPFCMAFSNHIAAYTVSFVPGALVPLFDVLLKSFPLALLMAVAITALAHFLTRRLLASRVRLVAVLSIYVAALLLTVVVDVLWASAIFDVAPWRLLQPHA